MNGSIPSESDFYLQQQPCSSFSETPKKKKRRPTKKLKEKAIGGTAETAPVAGLDENEPRPSKKKSKKPVEAAPVAGLDADEQRSVKKVKSKQKVN